MTFLPISLSSFVAPIAPESARVAPIVARVRQKLGHSKHRLRIGTYLNIWEPIGFAVDFGSGDFCQLAGRPSTFYIFDLHHPGRLVQVAARA